MYDFNDDQIQQLLSFMQNMPQDEYQVQDVPVEQGLLGSTGDEKQQMDALSNKATQASEEMAQRAQAMAQPNTAGQGMAAQRTAQNEQAAQQAMAQQQAAQQAGGSLLGKLISLLIPGGGLLGYLKGKL